MTEQTTPAGHAPSPRDLAARAGAGHPHTAQVTSSPPPGPGGGSSLAGHPAAAVPRPAAGSPPAPADPADTAHAARPAATGVAPRQVTGAQALILALEQLGTEVVFGLPGGAI